MTGSSNKTLSTITTINFDVNAYVTGLFPEVTWVEQKEHCVCKCRSKEEAEQIANTLNKMLISSEIESKDKEYFELAAPKKDINHSIFIVAASLFWEYNNYLHSHIQKAHRTYADIIAENKPHVEKDYAAFEFYPNAGKPEYYGFVPVAGQCNLPGISVYMPNMPKIVEIERDSDGDIRRKRRRGTQDFLNLAFNLPSNFERRKHRISGISAFFDAGQQHFSIQSLADLVKIVEYLSPVKDKTREVLTEFKIFAPPLISLITSYIPALSEETLTLFATMIQNSNRAQVAIKSHSAEAKIAISFRFSDLCQIQERLSNETQNRPGGISQGKT